METNKVEFGVRIKNEHLFPFRGEMLITRHEAKELRDSLNSLDLDQ